MSQELVKRLHQQLIAPVRGEAHAHVAHFIRSLEPSERQALRDHVRSRSIKIELTPLIQQALNGVDQ